MATALPNTTNMLKLVTVAPVSNNAIASSPESATASKFWVIKFITVGFDLDPEGILVGVGVVVSVSFAGTVVWRMNLPKGSIYPFHKDFGAGLYTGTKNEDFTIDIEAADVAGISLSYGYF